MHVVDVGKEMHSRISIYLCYVLQESLYFLGEYHVDSRGSYKHKVGFTNMPLWDQARFNLLLSPLNHVVRAISRCKSDASSLSHSKHAHVSL